MRSNLRQFLVLVALGISQIAQSQALPNDQLDRLKQQLDLLNREAIGLRNDLNDINFQVDAASRDADRIQYSLDDSRRRLDQTLSDLKELETTIPQLRNQVADAKRRRDEQINQLTVVINQAPAQIAAKQTDIDKANSDIARLNGLRDPAKIAAIQKDIAALQATRVTTKKQYDDNKVELDKLATCNSTECIPVKLARQQIDQQLSAKLADLDKQIFAKQKDISDVQVYETQYQARLRDLAGYKAQLASLNSTLVQNRDRLQRLKNSSLPEEMQLAEAIDRQARLSGSVESLRRDVDEQSRNLASARANVDNLQMRRNTINQQLFSVDDQIRIVQQQIDQLQQQLARPLYVAGGLLTIDQRNQIQSSGANLVFAEDVNAASTIMNSLSTNVTVLVDTLVISDVQLAIFPALEQVIQAKGIVTLIGITDPLFAIPQASGLMATCDNPIQTSNGQTTICHSN